MNDLTLGSLVAAGLLGLGFVVGYTIKGAYWRTRYLIKKGEVEIKNLAELQKLNQELEKKNQELHSKEFELSSANKDLKNLDQAKSKFVAVTTHQMRTPLTAIKWTFDMLATGQLGGIDAKQKEFIDKGRISTERMIKIVNQLLALDSVEGSEGQYVFVETDIDQLISDTVKEFSSQAERKQQKIEIEKPERSLPKIDCDPGKVIMVIENLLDNAVKYSATGSTITVKISDAGLNRSPSTIEIAVKDKGIGIKPDDQKKIFTKFFRSADAVRTEPDGSGLGLYLSKDIIEHHGGVLWFEAQPDGGTIFKLTLPVHQKKV